METAIIILTLITLNGFLLYKNKHRKRKYGLFPTIVFFVLFIGYIGYYIIPYKSAIDKKESIYKTRLKTTRNKQTGEFSSNIYALNQEDSQLKNHITILDYLIRSVWLQALLALILAIWGIIDISGRNAYYTKMIVLHLILLCCTYFIDFSDHFTRRF